MSDLQQRVARGTGLENYFSSAPIFEDSTRKNFR
jgi:hypothetical protein